MTDPRPRPQYGEYATPEQQRAAGGFVPPSMEPPTEHAVAEADITAEKPARRPGDVFATTALLAIGAYLTIGSSAGFLALGDTLTTLYAANGYDPYTSGALADGLGLFLVVFQTSALIIVAFLSIRWLRASRPRTFLIPLAGGVITFVVTFIVLMIAMLVDPALASSVQG